MKIEEVKKELQEEAFFKGKEIEIKNLQPIEALQWVYLVTDKKTGKKYRVKTRKEKIEKEVKTIRFLEKFPKQEWTPEILYLNKEEDILITNYIEGISLDKIEKIEEGLAERLGRDLYTKIEQMHAISYPFYNIIKEKEYENWYQMLKEQYEEYLILARRINFLNKEEVDLIENAIEELKEEFLQVKPTFVHADLKGANLVLQEDKIIPIDFEIGFVGDPDYDWARIVMKTRQDRKTKKTTIFQNCIEVPNIAKEMKKLRESKKYLLYYLKVLIEWYVLDYTKIGKISETPAKETKEILEIFKGNKKQEEFNL